MGFLSNLFGGGKPQNEDPRAKEILMLLITANNFDEQGEHAKATYAYSKAANLGDHNAQCIMGTRCLTGKGCPQDEDTAYDWYKLSADQGNAEAIFSIAMLLVSPKGELKNIPPEKRREIQYEYLHEAARLGHQTAKNMLRNFQK